MPTLNQKFLTVAEVAAMLSCCRHTVLRMVQKGDLRAHRFNRRLMRFTVEDVNQFIKNASSDNSETPEQFQKNIARS